MGHPAPFRTLRDVNTKGSIGWRPAKSERQRISEAVARELILKRVHQKGAAMTPPETMYARSGDVRIAYQVVGNGPFDLVF
jgi:hypothetical protein